MNSTAEASQIVGLQFHWLEQKWDGWYEYMDNDMLATGIMLLAVHELVYFGRNVPWAVLDMMPSMRKYKIQDKRPPTRKQYLECLRSVLLSHIFVEAFPIFGFHFVCDYFNIAYRAPFPAISTMCAQLAVLFLMEDTWHYFGHRLLHTPYLYKRVHKQHHRFAAPFGLTAEYAHPIEVAFTGTGTVGSPLLLAYIMGGMHLLTIMVWIVLRLVQAIDAHSGFEFPFSLHHFFPMWAGADHHDDHHHYFVGNYSSSFRHWDYFLGTETPATTRRRDHNESPASKRNEVVIDPDDKLEMERSAVKSGAK